VIHLPGSIAGSVYASSESDAATPASGTGITGVRLELLSDVGAVLAEALTGDDGRYEFPALEPGVYGVRQTQPAGWKDIAAKVGSGGGAAVTLNLVTQIVVQAGAMLREYDFVEQFEPVAAEASRETLQGSAPFIPPLTVSWSRPLAGVGEPIAWPVAASRLPSPPPELRPPEPAFGGSSGVVDGESINEAYSDAEFIEQLAKTPQRDENAEAGERVAMTRPNSRARDQAFELEGEEQEDVAEAADERVDSAPRPTQRAEVRTRVIVRKPAA
jgi:hypothetical protein